MTAEKALVYCYLKWSGWFVCFKRPTRTAEMSLTSYLNISVNFVTFVSTLLLISSLIVGVTIRFFVCIILSQ